MKATSVLFFFCMISGFLNAQSNIYHPFPQSNAVWNEIKEGDQCWDCSKYEIYITGTIQVDEKTYYTLQAIGDNYNIYQPRYCNWSSIAGSFNNYVGAYRNDSINRKVYYFDPYTQTDTLLYDFNLKLNDTLPRTYIYNPVVQGRISFISKIDSVLIGQEYRKRFELSVYNYDSTSNAFGNLIEGIGSSQGLLSDIWNAFVCSNLVCFKLNGVTVYPDSSAECVISSTDMKKMDKTAFRIFPNPIRTYGQVFLNSNFEFVDLIIVDVLGISQLIIKDVRNNDKISFAQLKRGVYLYKAVRGFNIISNGNFIKIE